MENRDEQFFSDVRDELAEARRKFPGNKHKLAATTEELGELAQAMIDHSRGKKTAGQVYYEAVQLATMATRIATEGDAEFLYSWERAQRDIENAEVPE